MEKEIYNVCDKCGIEANRLTCLKRYGREPLLKKFTISTYHMGKCDVCGKVTGVTEARDFFHPDFSLLNEKLKITNKAKDKLKELEKIEKLQKETKELIEEWKNIPFWKFKKKGETREKLDKNIDIIDRFLRGL